MTTRKCGSPDQEDHSKIYHIKGLRHGHPWKKVDEISRFEKKKKISLARNFYFDFTQFCFIN